MKKSESIANISAALHKCQAEMGGVTKNAANPFFKSSYADLTAVMKVAKPIWHSHGIAVIQHPHSSDRGVGVSTLIMHTSGEWIEHEYTLPLVKADPQAAGSAITYARRYSLQAVALIPAVDDDAESAMLRDLPKSEEQIKAEYNMLVLENKASIEAIKDSIATGDYSYGYEAWCELGEDVQRALWKAPSKGGCFTTKEREVMKTPEFRGA